MLDEATAAVDHESDALIARTVGEAFADRTLLVIAHRLHTIADSDKIMVLDQGEVAEFDSPQRLMATEGSIYRSLVEESNSSTPRG
mgnify:CR=1 FL=1